MRLRWTEPAALDLDDIGTYYAAEAGERLAAENVLRIIRAAETLLELPVRARPGRVPGTRELVLEDLPYIIPFRVVGEDIQILRVFHTARKPPRSW